MGKAGLIVMGLATSLLLIGCQSNHLAQSNVGDFQAIWNSYTQCQSAADLDTIRQASGLLNKAASNASDQTEFVLPLPVGVARYVAKPSLRLSVDPKAVAAACSLHVADKAFELGKVDLALQTYQSVLISYGQPEYAYYRTQARQGLSRINSGRTASLSPALFPTSH